MTPASFEDWRHGGFGIYVHWPFCAAKCPYCDFNSHVTSDVDQRRWAQALVTELRWMAERVPGRQVDTIFFGGGTPSLMDESTVASVIGAIGDLWPLGPDVEISLEANPTSVEATRFEGYRKAGVNRLSLGVQALNDRDLKALGRRHDAAEAMEAFGIARDAFARVSFDLIYARQRQSLSEWEDELFQALAMAVDHLSLYQLTIEAGTRFGELAARNRLRDLPTDDAAAEMYELTRKICEAAGLPAYEISNHARPGAECRHNLVYWNYGDYVGVGPGAHGRLTIDGNRQATSTLRDPSNWLASVEQNRNGIIENERVAPEDQASELMMMGLRTREGVDLARYEQLAGAPLCENTLRQLCVDGLITRERRNLKATDKGKLVLNSILGALLA